VQEYQRRGLSVFTFDEYTRECIHLDVVGLVFKWQCYGICDRVWCEIS